jgi:hypothetical protein
VGATLGRRPLPARLTSSTTGNSVTTLSLAVLAIMVYGVLNRHGYGRALALGGVTASGAAVVVGSVAVPTFYAVALGAVVGLGLQLLGNGSAVSGPRRRLPPGVPLLLIFSGWSVLVTLVAPFVFDGLTVYTPVGAGRLAAGFLTSSNVAQIIYIALGICVVLFIARSTKAGPELIGLVSGTATLLCLWRYLNQTFGLPFPEGVLDNSPGFAYIEMAPGAVERFRGIFSEPSGVAGSCLVTIAYMVPRAFQVQGVRRVGALLLAAIAIFLGVISTSTTFVVAGVAVAAIAVATFLLRFVLRRTGISAVGSVAVCAVVIAALWVLPTVADFVEAAVDQKMSSASFTERSSANTGAIEVLLNSFGLGAGLGSNRASSFVPTLLSTTGVVGTLLFAALVTVLIRRGVAVQRYRPGVWALVSLLVAKVVAGPDLHDTTGVMWLSLGLLSGAVATQATGSAPPEQPHAAALPVPTTVDLEPGGRSDG